MARDSKVYTGLHLNFTTEFTSPRCPPTLLDHQRRVSRFLLKRPGAQVLFHPGLVSSFEYLVRAQYDEFATLYGCYPERLDGHHHMHLCANVLFQRLLPRGTIVRRNFSFGPGEKSVWNLMYRRTVDIVLARRHRVTDYFFSIAPLEPSERLHHIFALATDSVVEVETHPADRAEYRFLMSGEVFQYFPSIAVAHTVVAQIAPYERSTECN